MLSFSEFKQSLGESAHKYTDEQIEWIRIAFDQIADVHTTAWTSKIWAHNNDMASDQAHEPNTKEN